MARRIYCIIDDDNNVIESVRGDGIVLDKNENWIDVTELPEAHTLTEVHTQKRVKVFPGMRKASGKKKPTTMYRKPDFKLKVDKSKIRANGEDAAILELESLQGITYSYPIKLQVNGQIHEVKAGEEIRITSDVNQRIGVTCADPDIKLVPKTIFIQAHGREEKDETHPSKRKG